MKFLFTTTISLFLLSFFQAKKTFATSVYFTDFASEEKRPKKKTVLYGQASFYAAKFQGRKTASGEIFNHSKLTAACNMLPLGTWVKVTNLKNGKTVVVKTNDRLHNKTSRLLDLTKAGATQLGFVKSGLARVKIEVLQSRPDNNTQ